MGKEFLAYPQNNKGQYQSAFTRVLNVFFTFILALVDAVCMFFRNIFQFAFGQRSTKEAMEERRIVNILEFNFFALTGYMAKVYIGKSMGKKAFFLLVENKVGNFLPNNPHLIGTIDDFAEDSLGMKKYLKSVLSESRCSFVEIDEDKWAECLDCSSRLVFGNKHYAQSNFHLYFRTLRKKDSSVFPIWANTLKMELNEELSRDEVFVKLLHNKLCELFYEDDEIAVFFSKYGDKTYIEVLSVEKKDFIVKNLMGEVEKKSFVVCDKHSKKAEEVFNIIDSAVRNYEYNSKRNYQTIYRFSNASFNLFTKPTFTEQYCSLSMSSDMNAFIGYCCGLKIHSIEKPDVAVMDFIEERMLSFEFNKPMKGFLQQGEKCAFDISPFLDTVALQNTCSDTVDLENLVREKAIKVEDLFYASNLLRLSNDYDVRIAYFGNKELDTRPMIDIFLFHRKHAVTFRFAVFVGDFLFNHANIIDQEWQRIRREEQYAIYEAEELSVC